MMAKADDELNAIPFDLTDTDRANLAGGDENFQPHNWEDLKHIIGRISYLLEPLESLSYPSIQRPTIFRL